MSNVTFIRVAEMADIGLQVIQDVQNAVIGLLALRIFKRVILALHRNRYVADYRHCIQFRNLR